MHSLLPLAVDDCHHAFVQWKCMQVTGFNEIIKKKKKMLKIFNSKFLKSSFKEIKNFVNKTSLEWNIREESNFASLLLPQTWFWVVASLNKLLNEIKLFWTFTAIENLFFSFFCRLKFNWHLTLRSRCCQRRK